MAARSLALPFPGPFPNVRPGCCLFRGTGFSEMTKTFDTISDIIADVCNVDRDKIAPDSHVINDLGIDSLDFLDVTFAIDKSFGIKMPIQKWTEEVNADNSKAERYFVMKNLCTRIDELVAAKGA